MFYYPSVLHRHTGRFATIWLAATRGTKIVKREYLKVNVSKTCEEIIAYVLVQVAPLQPGDPRPRFSLYLSSQLGYGVVCVYHKQCDYLIDEIKVALERLRRSHKQLRIDMDQPEQAGLLLPDHLSIMEAHEDAPDPFFGVMDVEPELPSPMNIPQLRCLLETPSPERRRLEHTPPRPRTRRPVSDREHVSSPERITLREEEPIRLPEVEFDRDLQEITAQELEFLMGEEVAFPTDEVPTRQRERRGVPKRKPGEIDSVERTGVPELDVQMEPVSLPSREREERGPEFDTPILLDEVTGEPIVILPAPDLPAEVTPVETQMPPPPAASPVAAAAPRSPELQLADIYLQPEAAPRRRRRQLRFIDEVTQIPRAEMQKLLDDVHAHTRPRPPVELPRNRRSPADLLNNPTYDGWMPPELLRLWSRCARVQSVDYASRRSAAAQEAEEDAEAERRQQEEESEQERRRQQEEEAQEERRRQQEEEAREEGRRQLEGISELELEREGLERTGPLMLSELSLEVSEEEKSRQTLLTPEERRITHEAEELPILLEQPELVVPEDVLITDEINLDTVRRMVQVEIEKFGETDFETLVPYTLSRLTSSNIFFILLVLSSMQILKLEQKEPYKRILIRPGPRFYQ